MARLYTGGAELGHAQADGLIVSGAPTIDTAVKRSGVASYKAAATNTYHRRDIVSVLGRTYYFRFYYLFPSNPTGLHRIFYAVTTTGTGICSMELNHVGRVLRLLDSTGAVLATGTASLNANQWYRVEVAMQVNAAGNGLVELRIDGAVDIAPASVAIGNIAITRCYFGVVSGNIGGLAAVYHDDIAINDDQGADQNSWPGVGSVYALLGAADPGTGTATANWTKPGGATTDRHTSLDNSPPIYQADSTAAGDAEKFLRNPTNALSDLELTLEDYDTAGVPSGEAISLVQPVAGTGSTSSTDTAGAIEGVSNPAIPSRALTTFDNNIASAVATTWPYAQGTVVYNPAVARGTGPVLRLQRAAAARTVMVNMLALLVETAPSMTPPPEFARSIKVVL